MKVLVNAREVDAWLDSYAAAHAGIISVDSAHQAGVTEKALRHRIGNGRLRPVAKGVLAMRCHAPSWQGQLWTALLEAGDGAVAGLRSAGRLHSLWRYRTNESVEIVVRRGGNHRCATGRLVETSLLDPGDVVVVDGLPCTSLARTIFDLLGDPDHRPLRSDAAMQWHEDRMMAVVNDAMRHHGLTVLVELVVLASIGRRGRSGTALTRKIFTNLGADYVPDESQVESVFSALLTRSSLPAPVRQLEISDAVGFIGRVDFAWPELMLIVEIDSSFHDGPLDRRADAVRDARLRALGYDVIRLRWTDLVTSPDAVLRRLRRAARRLEPAVNPAPSGARITAHS
jgi:very-short-patch-repair endonuclease